MKKKTDEQYCEVISQVTTAAQMFLSDDCPVKINDLQRDVLRSAINYDLTEATVSAALSGDKVQLQRLMDACQSVSVITGHRFWTNDLFAVATQRQQSTPGGVARGEQMTAQADSWAEHGKRVLAEKIHNLNYGYVADKRSKGKLPSTADVHSDLADQWDTIQHDDKIKLPSLRWAQKELTSWKNAGLFSPPKKEDISALTS